MSTVSILLNTVFEDLARAVRQMKEIKGIQIGREEVKVPLLTDDTILYMNNLKDYTKKLLQLILSVK